MSTTAVFAAVSFAALQLFLAGLAMHDVLSVSLTASASASAARVEVAATRY